MQGLVDGPRDPGRVGARRQPQAGRVAQRAAQRQVAVDDVVLRNEADSRLASVRHRGTVVQHGPGRGRPQPGHGLEQSGLAGAAAADEGDQLAGRQRERHLVQELPAAGVAGHGEHVHGHAVGHRAVGWHRRIGGSEVDRVAHGQIVRRGERAVMETAGRNRGDRGASGSHSATKVDLYTRL